MIIDSINKKFSEISYVTPIALYALLQYFVLAFYIANIKIVNKLIVAVSNDYSKDYLFSSEERVSIIKNSLFKDLKFDKKRLKILSFNILTTSLCKKNNATIIFRGLRAASDFEYEFQLAGMNRKLNKNVETIFLMSDVQNQIISSRLIKEIIELKGDIKKFTTKSTINSLKKKIWINI